MKDFLYCLIFPHPRNNHRANFLHPKAIFLVALFFLFSSLFFPSNLNPISSKLIAIADVSVWELVDLTNAKRIENGLPALAVDSALSEAADKKAEDMFAKNYWAHNSPDGTTPWVFIKNSGYNYVYAGENLARGFSNSSDVVNAWMASPNHRANVLSSNFKDIGFAVKSGNLNGEETFLVVQQFGSREVFPVSPKPVIKKLEVSKVLGFNISSYIPKTSTLSLSSKFAILLIGGIMIVLLSDMIIVKRKKIVRFVGHNMDHVVFLLAIVFIIEIFNTGVVL